MRDAAPVQYILFDLGNVIVDWEPLRLYRQRFETAEEAEWFCTHVCTPAWHVEHDRGRPMADNREALIARYPEYEAHIRAWQADWLDMFHGYVAGMEALVGRIEARGLPLYGLSNIPAEVAEATFDAFPLIHRFRDVVVSGAEGVVKPDRRIYEIALARMGHPSPEAVLFIDDRLENVAAAEALGLQGHHFQSAERLERDLVGRGLL